MKLALCNEMFGKDSLDAGLRIARDLGYEGIEFAPFTFAPDADPFHVNEVSPAATNRSRHASSRSGSRNRRRALAAGQDPGDSI